MAIGIDLGSRNVKAAWRKGDGTLSLYSEDTFEFYRRFVRKAGEELVLLWDELPFLRQNAVMTGYGHLTLKMRDAEDISELEAHLLGAVAQTGLRDFTLLDLGGQDAKILAVASGRLVDFSLNDKCGAGSGRYLENMAKLLSMTVEEAGQCSEDPVSVNSTCAVFGESELIGLMVQGYRREQLMAGVNRSIIKRVLPFLRRHRAEKIVFTGGPAASPALRRILAAETGNEVIVPAHHRHNGAIGCLAAAENGQREV